jgi:hypothetical protein
MALSARVKLVPLPVFSGRDKGLIKGQQQVPHWAFGPVRNDIGLFLVVLIATLKRRSFTVALAAVGVSDSFGHSQIRVKKRRT